MSLDFFPGQAVVCVNSRSIGDSGFCRELEEGKQYTVRDVVEWHGRPYMGCVLAIHLTEIMRKKDLPLAVIRFRPVEYKAMDTFREIARTTKLPKRDKQRILEES